MWRQRPEPRNSLTLALRPPSILLPDHEERPEVDPADPGAQPFNLARDEGRTISIGFSRKGFAQNWTGVVERVNPAMGFINVTRPDFHLHLRAATVSGWQRSMQDGTIIDAALDAEGMPTGLVVRTRTEGASV